MPLRPATRIYSNPYVNRGIGIVVLGDHAQSPMSIVNKFVMKTGERFMQNDNEVAGTKEGEVTGLIESQIAASVYSLFRCRARLNGGRCCFEGGW